MPAFMKNESDPFHFFRHVFNTEGHYIIPYVLTIDSIFSLYIHQQIFEKR